MLYMQVGEEGLVNEFCCICRCVGGGGGLVRLQPRGSRVAEWHYMRDCAVCRQVDPQRAAAARQADSALPEPRLHHTDLNPSTTLMSEPQHEIGHSQY